MNKNKKLKKTIIRTGKSALLLVLLLGAVAGGGRLFLKTDWMTSFIHKTAERQLNKHLNGQLTIGTVKGDAGSRLVIYDILLRQKGDTLAAMDSLVLDYELMPLFRKTLVLEEIMLGGPQIFAKEQKDGRWNLQNVFTPTSFTEDSSASATAFNIKAPHISLDGGEVSVEGRSIPGGQMIFTYIYAEGQMKYDEKGYEAHLLSFNTHIDNKLIDRGNIKASGSADSQSFNLNSLLVSTAHSLLKAAGKYKENTGNLSVDAVLKPPSWHDLKTFESRSPVQKDIQSTLTLRGQWPEMEVLIGAGAKGLDTLSWSTGFRLDDSHITMRELKLNAQNIDFSVLLDSTGLPAIERVEGSAEGIWSTKNSVASNMDARWTLQNFIMPGMTLDEINGQASLNQKRLEIKTDIRRQNEHWRGNISSPDIFAASPRWALDIKGNRVDLGYWSGKSNVRGTFNTDINIKGKGFEPNGISPWNYSIKLNDIVISGQQSIHAATGGQITNQRITSSGHVSIKESMVRFNAKYDWQQKIPGFAFNLELLHLNLADLKGFEQFPTDINGRISGEGTGIEPASVHATAAINIDSSRVNGALVSELSGRAKLSDSLLLLENVLLKSVIAEGNLAARLHTHKYYDPENRLDIEGNVLDVSSLAPLLNFDHLKASGSLSGTLQPNSTGTLKYNGNINLHNIELDDFGRIDSLAANLSATIAREPVFVLNMGLKNPELSGIILNDLVLYTDGRYTENSASGYFELEFNSPGRQAMTQGGRYTLSADSAIINTQNLMVQGVPDELLLERPFDIVVNNRSVRMDTMKLNGQNGSSLNIALPVFGNDEFSMFASARKLDLGSIQQTLLNKTLAEGTLDSYLRIHQTANSLSMKMENSITGFSYQNRLTFDTLASTAEIHEEVFSGTFEAFMNNDIWARGNLNVPFRMGNPDDFGEEFFNETVSGQFIVPQTNLGEFNELLRQWGLAETTGNAEFKAVLDGKAGEPNLKADLKVTELTTSGVKLDSVQVGFDYKHSERHLLIDSKINSVGQKLAVLNARIPLYIDLKKFTVRPPQPTDSIQADIVTNKFNLAAINDFADPRVIRNISGFVDGGITIQGTPSSPEILGSLLLTKGRLQLVPAGMIYTGIESSVDFKGDELRIASFNMRGDRGTITGNGTVILDNMIPEKMDLKIRAKTFKAANTKDLNLIISADSRISGAVTRPVIEGKLTINSGFYFLKNFGEKAVEKVRLDSEEPEKESLQVDLYDNLTMDLEMNITKAFSIRNRRFMDMQIDLTGQMDMVKQPQKHLQIFGVLNAEKGFAKPLGKTFRLNEGTITFDGNAENPLLNITTQYNPPQPTDITIFYKITGRADNPKFVYESIPEMDKKNILSYTLFGQPFYGIDSWKQVVASPEGGNSAVSDLALNVMLDRVETLATRRLGIDVVQIDNTQNSTGSSTTLRTGWYLNEKTFFAVLNELSGSSPDTQFLLEYFLKNNLKLILTQGQDNRTGLDISWQYDY